MSDTLTKIILSFISLGIAVGAFFGWQKKKNFWLLLAVITALLAAAAFWLGPMNGALLGFLALALLFLGLWSKRGSR